MSLTIGRLKIMIRKDCKNKEDTKCIHLKKLE